MTGEPGACQHLRSPGTVSCGSHRRSRNRLSTPPQAARSVQPRRPTKSHATAQLTLGDVGAKQQERLPSADRTTSAKPCSTSYSLHSEECASCGRPLTGKALVWWSKLDRYSHQHRSSRLKQCCSPTAHSTAAGAGRILSPSHKRSNSVKAGRPTDGSNKLLRDSDIPSLSDEDSDQPPEAGIISEASVTHVQTPPGNAASKAAASASQGSAAYASPRTVLYPAKEQGNIKDSWQTLMRWSKVFKKDQNGGHVLDKIDKVVVFGGGSFGTAMGVALARQKSTLNVSLLLRDAYICRDINSLHTNTRYLPVSSIATQHDWYAYGQHLHEVFACNFLACMSIKLLQLPLGAVSNSKVVASLTGHDHEAVQSLHVVIDNVSCQGNFSISASTCICVSGPDAAH